MMVLFKSPKLDSLMKEEPLLLDLNNPAISALGSELANKTGRKILMMLAKGPMSAGMLAEELGIPVNTVLFHIKRLEEAGIIKIVEITAGRRGRRKVYSLVSTSIILTVDNKERTIRSLRSWLEGTSKTLWLAARPIIPVILVAIFLAWGWTFFGPAIIKPQIQTLGEKGSFQAPQLPEALRAENVSVAEVKGISPFFWALILSLLSAISSLFLSFLILRRK